MLERRVIARAELAEALAAPGPEAEEPVRPVQVPVVSRVVVAGSVVPPWRGEMTAQAFAPDYQRLLGVLEAQVGAGFAFRWPASFPVVRIDQVMTGKATDPQRTARQG